jgi:hypothetical protein
MCNKKKKELKFITQMALKLKKSEGGFNIELFFFFKYLLIGFVQSIMFMFDVLM